MTTLTQHNRLKGHKGSVNSVAFGPDSRLLASGEAGSIILWDVSTNQQIGRLQGESAAFSPDGAMLVSGDPQGFIYLWNLSHTSSPEATALTCAAQDSPPY